MKKVFLILIIVFFSERLFAQTPDSLSIDDFIFENLNLDNSGSQQSLIENQYFQQTNRDLNAISKDELLKTGFFNSVQVDSIIARRENAGKFLSIFELQAIPCISINEAKAASQYFTVTSEPVFNSKGLFYIRTGKNSEQKMADAANQIRFRFQKENLTTSLVLDKDAYEKFDWKPQKNTFGYDFTSFYIKKDFKGKLKTLIIGDYRMQAGQGLLLGGGFYLPKSGDPILSTLKPSQSILPSQSSLEYGYWRGIASRWKMLKSDFMLGLSMTKRDARLSDSGNTVETIYYTGTHVTNSELANKAVRNEVSAGLSWEKKIGWGNIGINSLISSWDKPLTDGNYIYQKANYLHHQNWLNSIYGMQRIRGLILRFELANQYQLNKTATVVNALLPLGDKLELSFVYRNYPFQFYSPFAASFADGIDRSNEKGFYTGFKYRIHNKLTLSSFVDYFVNPNALYQYVFGKNGYDVMLRMQWDKSKKASLFTQIRYGNATQYSTISDKAYFSKYQNSSKAQISVKYNEKIDLNWQYNTGFLYNKILSSGTDGLAVWQSVTYKKRKGSVTGRVVWFHCKNYLNRMYLPEQDMSYQFYMPMLYGEGFRLMMLVKYKIIAKNSLGFKMYKNGGSSPETGFRVQFTSEF